MVSIIVFIIYSEIQFKSIQLSLEQTKYKEINKDSSKFQKLCDNLKTNEIFDDYLNFDDEEDDDEFSSHFDDDSVLNTSFKFNRQNDIDLKLNKIVNKNENKNEKSLNNNNNETNNSICLLELKSNKNCKLNNEKQHLIREDKVFSHIDDNINSLNMTIINENNNNTRIKKVKLKNNKKINIKNNDSNRKIIKKSSNKKGVKNKKGKLNDDHSMSINKNISNQMFHSSSENYSPTSSISTSNTSFTSYDYQQSQQISYNQQQQQRQQLNLASSNIYSPGSNSNTVYSSEFFDLIQPNRFHEFQFATTTKPNNLITSSYQHYNQPNYSNKIFQNSKLNPEYNNSYQCGLGYTKNSSSSSPLTISPLSIDSSIKVNSANKSNQDITNMYLQKLDIDTKSQPNFNNSTTEISYKNISFNSLNNNIDQLRNSSSINSPSNMIKNNLVNPLNLENNNEGIKDIETSHNNDNKIGNKQKIDKTTNKDNKTNFWNENICENVQSKEITNIDYLILNSKDDANKNSSKNNCKNKQSLISNNLYENSLNIDSSNSIFQGSINHYHYHQSLNYNLHLYKTGLANTNYSTNTIQESVPVQMTSNFHVLYNNETNKTDTNQQLDGNEIYSQNSQFISNRLHLPNFNETKNFNYYNNNLESRNGINDNTVNNNTNEGLTDAPCYDYHSSNRTNVVSQGFVMIN